MEREEEGAQVANSCLTGDEQHERSWNGCCCEGSHHPFTGLPGPLPSPPTSVQTCSEASSSYVVLSLKPVPSSLSRYHYPISSDHDCLFFLKHIHP